MKPNKRHPLTFNKAGASFAGEQKSGNYLLIERFCPGAFHTQTSSGTNTGRNFNKTSTSKETKVILLWFSTFNFLFTGCGGEKKRASGCSHSFDGRAASLTWAAFRQKEGLQMKYRAAQTSTAGANSRPHPPTHHHHPSYPTTTAAACDCMC